MTLSDPIAEGMTAVTVGTTPQLLRHPEIPVLDQTRYELKYYFSIDTTIKEEESHPFKEAMFNFYIPVITQYERGKVSLMRYNSDEREWFRIPTERVSCDAKGCDYVSISPGTSVFAIAVEKDEPEMPAQERLGEGYLVAAIAFGLLLGIGVIAWRHRSAARFAHGGKKP